MRVFGERRLSQLRSPAIAAWRMTIPAGHRFEATQALRQVLARVVSWGLLDVNPAKLGVENPQRRYTEKRPFESWDELHALAGSIGPRHGPMVLFAAGTGAPPEWLALEHRDIDREAQVVYVRRTLRNGRIKSPKTKASVRAVPLQAIALAALDALPPNPDCSLLFPSVGGGYLDLHNFRNRNWKPAQKAAGIEPRRRVYDLRHTFVTFALRAGISTFDLSRYMGTSLAMIDRRYGHLARDGREHAIRLLDTYTAAESLDVHAVDAGWTPNTVEDANRGNGRGVGVRRLDRRTDHRDLIAAEDLVEGVAELRVSVVDEEPERPLIAELHGEVARLLRGPEPVRVGGAGDVLDPPGRE